MVTRDVPTMTVVGGVPAKVLKVIQEEKERYYETAVSSINFVYGQKGDLIFNEI